MNGINQAEQLKSKSQYGLAAIKYTYDAAGHTLTKTNGRGTTSYAYDSEGRLTSEQAPGDTQATTFTYDPNGAQLTATDASGTISTQYDEAGRTTKTTDSFGATSTFSYDADGNTVNRVATPIAGGTAYTTGYSYDTGDELTAQTDPVGRQWQYFYDGRGNLHAVQYPNGTFNWIDLNAAGWTTHSYNRHGNLSAPLPSSAPADGINSPIADFGYSYNDAGQKTQETRTAGTNVQTSSYQYDNLGRLSQATLPNGTVRQYSFDLDSNRTVITDNGIITASYIYDPATTRGVDELTSVGSTNYAYNGDGEVTGYGGNTLAWDGWQRAAGSTFGGTTVSYTYDPAGALRSRATATKTTNYLLGDLFETDGTGALTTSYVDGATGDLAEYDGPPISATPVSFLYYSGHGDLTAEADTSGSSTANHTYTDPFGAPVETQPANSTVHLYTGRWNKQYDTTSKLILMGARPYDPTLGRFLAADPVEGGSLNNYDYAGQDPVNGYDLNGTNTHWSSWGDFFSSHLCFGFLGGSWCPSTEPRTKIYGAEGCMFKASQDYFNVTSILKDQGQEAAIKALAKSKHIALEEAAKLLEKAKGWLGVIGFSINCIEGWRNGA